MESLPTPPLSNENELLQLNDNFINDDVEGDFVANGKTMTNVPTLESSGRDSGISTESPRYQELNSKYADIELHIEESVVSSQRELQDAKQRLEELRLLRFEEKNVLRKEIEQLHDRVDEGERNTNQLEEKLTKVRSDKVVQAQRLKDLEKELEIGSQINMMQEKEIVRLEMRLKEEEIEGSNISKQLDQHRKSVIEKDKLRMKQQSELYVLNERIQQLEASNASYKSETECNINKLRDCDFKSQSMQEELTSLSCELKVAKTEATNARYELKQLEIKKSNLHDEHIEAQSEAEELRDRLEILESRYSKSEEEFKNRENTLQEDLQNASFNESKLVEQCEQFEKEYHKVRRERDEQYFELRQMTERTCDLENKVRESEEMKIEVRMELDELRNTLHANLTEAGKNAAAFKSPSKGKQGLITCDEISRYFQQYSTKMFSLHSEMEDLNTQMERERSVVGDLNSTISDLKTELNKAQGNISNISMLKETLQSQHQRTNETLRIQERDIALKDEEIEHLRNALSEYEQKLELLRSDLKAVNDDSQNSAHRFKEERKKLKIKLQELESQYQMNDSAKRRIELKLEEDKERFEENIQAKEKEKQELKDELSKLIEDNTNLAQRLIHLESYSDRLSDMLEKQQDDRQKLKEKASWELKQCQDISGEKELELWTLKNKMNEINKSLNEQRDTNNILGSKLKNITHNNDDLETKNNELERYNDELRKRLGVVNEAHMKAERKVISLSEDMDKMNIRCMEQNRTVEDLLRKANQLEYDRKTLTDNLQNAEKRIQLKENLIGELSRKSGQAAENFNSLRMTIEKAEAEDKQSERKVHELRKSLDEGELEKRHLREQVANLQHVLAKSEDEKEKSLNDVAQLQRQLSNRRATKERIEQSERENWRQKKDIKELKDQLSTLRSELDHERNRRERLEDMCNRRDDQVSQLRSTFDHSLSTLSKDTKNIKSILGKSLRKLDNEITSSGKRKEEESPSCSEITDDTTTEIDHTDYTPTIRSSGSRYLNLPTHHRSSKSLDTASNVNELYRHQGKPIVTTAPKSYHHRNDRKYTSLFISSNEPRADNIRETPVRDYTYERKSNKRMTK